MKWPRPRSNLELRLNSIFKNQPLVKRKVTLETGFLKFQSVTDGQKNLGRHLVLLLFDFRKSPFTIEL
jgi:hypothetical protein